MSDQRVSASRRIAASADALWAIVSDPAGHVRIDGSGMLVSAPDAAPLSTVGQTFDMHMDRRPLGDIPNLAEYSVRNTVTAVEPGRLIAWTIGPVDQPPFGHVYAWQLDPVDDHTTDVTNWCDWTDITDQLRQMRPDWPIVPVSMLEASVERLERVVGGQ